MRRIRASLLTVAWVVAAGACAPPPADTTFVNGRIFTADPARPWAEALAIRGGRLVAVGATADVRAAFGGATRIVDLGGRTVVPGFNDAHVTLDVTSAASIRAAAAAAAAAGVTSLQVFSTGPVSDTVAACVEADVPQRLRIVRMPVPDGTGVHRDSRPFFPPQPRPLLDVRGMGFDFGEADGDRLRQAVGWAYGSEDPLAVHGRSAAAIDLFVSAIEERGSPEVWRAKRPRLERPGSLTADQLARLARLGVVVVQAPSGDGSPLRAVRAASVPLALGSGGAARGVALVAWASRGAEAVTREDAVAGYTHGSAFAEFAEREKGRLAVGLLADLAVLSADLFSVPDDQIDTVRSLLTLVGGRAIHDTGTLR